MLYDEHEKNEQAILIKQKNGICYSIFPAIIGGFDACILSRYDQAQAISDRRGIFLSDTPFNMSICEKVTIENDVVTILALCFQEHIKQKMHKAIGCYSIDLDEIDIKKNCIYGEVIIDDVDSISADSRYFCALLNSGTITIDSEAMRKYNLTPRWVLYRNNAQNPKKYIK